MRAVGFVLVAGLCAASSGLAVTTLPGEGTPVPSTTSPDIASCAEPLPQGADPEALQVAPGPTLEALPRSRRKPDATTEVEPTPGDSASSEARPIIEVGADAQPPAAPVRRFSRWGGLVSVGACGEVSYELTWWNAAFSRDGFELVAYDLAPLAPTADDLCESLRGYRPADVPAAPGSPWWRGLCENIVRAVGADRWSGPATLLGWDAAASVLYVRQDADGQRRVEQYVERLARDRLSTIGLVAHLDARPDVEPLALQVPWGAPVRAHQGSTWLYVQDFEAEVSQEAFIAGPIVANVDTGFAVSARRVDGRDSSGDLEVEIAFSEDAPAFDRFETALACVPVVIEIPRPRRGFWRGVLAPCPAAYSIQLDDGRVVTLTVLGEDRDVPLVHGLVIRELRGASAPEGPEAPKEYLHLTWDVPGEQFTYDMELVPKDREGQASLLEGAAVVQQGVERGSPGTGLGGPISLLAWPQPDGGLRVRASTLRVADFEVVDLVLERAWAADEIRFPGGAPIDTSPAAPKWPALTVSRVRAESARVLLRRGGDDRVAVTGANGRTGLLRLSRFTCAPNP